eukprot:TRINITY_DN1148_c0_g1_i2.p1 TRINITY_DN1148_c0_g1~~TRINITY_DN1148_c0_g1_i2.p1  ORF type:complete len:104 (+),score=24.94 TRINITY_DN1148_c0_g1_i2:405-716(+)
MNYQRTILTIYRRILKTHQQLPQDMASMGNAYARSEFKTMKKVKDEGFVVQFIKSWKEYVSTIEKQVAENNSPVGKRLSPRLRAAMDDEQKIKLGELKRHTKK